jgi:hypothetical protein
VFVDFGTAGSVEADVVRSYVDRPRREIEADFLDYRRDPA